MTEATESDSPPPGMRAVLTDKQRAERLLFELASELRFVPVDEGNRGLHVRALELKAALSRWIGAPPPPEERRAVCDEIASLRARAQDALQRR